MLMSQTSLHFFVLSFFYLALVLMLLAWRIPLVVLCRQKMSNGCNVRVIFRSQVRLFQAVFIVYKCAYVYIIVTKLICDRYIGVNKLNEIFVLLQTDHPHLVISLWNAVFLCCSCIISLYSRSSSSLER